jgi:predicted SprT family Zn-dependent metalloprotease
MYKYNGGMTNTMKEIRELIEYACNEMGCDDLIPHIKVEWNNRFTTRLGDAKYSGAIRDPRPVALIRLSTKLWPTMKKEDQEDTILHETAHLIDSFVNGNRFVMMQDRSGHGRTWKEIARRVGARPRRFAKQSEAAFAKFARKKTKYTVKCACKNPHVVSKNLVTKMRKGQMRRCRRCNRLLRVNTAEVYNG